MDMNKNRVFTYLAAFMAGAFLSTLTPSVAAAAVPSVAGAKRPSGSVFVVGDSLTVGSKASLKRNLHKQFKKVTVDARVGRFTPEGISKLNSPAARKARVWVVALGTNDGPSAARTKANVNKVMKKAGKKRTVVWVNVVRPGGYGTVNKALSQQARKYDNLFVLNWASHIASNRSQLTGDRVHLTAKGYSVRGRMIANYVRSVSQ